MARFTVLLEPEQLDQLRALAVLRDCAVYELVAEGCRKLWEDLPSAERQRVAEFMALKAKAPTPGRSTNPRLKARAWTGDSSRLKT
ncbi:MAG: hypothetical protein KC777_30200, partial [Cyanobacteria bacterium HKST-UBA02]|nr:hypothetical protein [Cyanobacteria bacterium HKST-UBA02]